MTNEEILEEFNFPSLVAVPIRKKIERSYFIGEVRELMDLARVEGSKEQREIYALLNKRKENAG